LLRIEVESLSTLNPFSRKTEIKILFLNMKFSSKIIAMALMLGAVLLATAPQASAQGSTDMYSGTTALLLQKPVSVAASGTNVNNYVNLAGLEGVGLAVFTATNTAATGTMDSKLQGTSDLTNWVDIAGTSITQAGTSNTVQIFSVPLLGPYQYVRATNTVLSSGVFTYSWTILGKSKYRN
jgi:hypothetical protein